MKKFFSFFISTFMATLCLAAAPDLQGGKVFDLANEESKVEFKAVGKPSMLKINGTEGKLKGQVQVNGEVVSGEFIVPLDSVTTGISLRDEHMKKKYLETDKYPNAILKISELKLAKNVLKEMLSQKGVPFKGILNIHGNESPVEGTADIDVTEKVISIIAKTKTNITAHKIDLPTYLGVKVADVVDIITELKLKK